MQFHQVPLAAKPLQYALRLALITGQRSADVIRLSEADIQGGVLNIKQGKTGAKLRIAIEGELAALLSEIRDFKQALQVHALALLVNEHGQPLNMPTLRVRFDAARDAAGIPKAQFQFRDLRAKAATEANDLVDIKTAQAMLGHTT